MEFDSNADWQGCVSRIPQPGISSFIQQQEEKKKVLVVFEVLKLGPAGSTLFLLLLLHPSHFLLPPLPRSSELAVAFCGDQSTLCMCELCHLPWAPLGGAAPHQPRLFNRHIIGKVRSTCGAWHFLFLLPQKRVCSLQLKLCCGSQLPPAQSLLFCCFSANTTVCVFFCNLGEVLLC